MTAVGGAIESFSWGGREFNATGDNSVSLQLGGDTVETVSNGNGSFRNIVNKVLGTASGVALEVDLTKGDLEYLNDNRKEQDCTITFRDGSIYQSSSQSIQGDLNYEASTATTTLEIKGSKFRMM